MSEKKLRKVVVHLAQLFTLQLIPIESLVNQNQVELQEPRLTSLLRKFADSF